MSNTWRRLGAEGNEMRQRPQRHSRADLERLLDGRPGKAGALAELLTAARKPGGVPDTAGLDAAVSAFASLSPAGSYPSRRPSMTKVLAGRLLAAKMLALGGVAVAATAGGVALAASTGHLSNPLPHSSHAAAAATSAHASAKASETEASTGTEAAPSDQPTRPNATPSPSLAGLCQSWLARPHTSGKADTNPAFTVLVTAAGTTDAVNGFCTALLASSTPSAHGNSAHPTARPSAAPGNPGHPSGKPSAAPGNPGHPTGKPSTVPAPKPSHSTGP